MYLIQERLLKRHRMNSVFQHLPSIHDLAVAMQRVLVAGLILLTVGLIAGFFAGKAGEHKAAIAWAIGVWLLYGTLLVLGWTHRFSARRIAWMSVAAFTIALTTLGAMSFIHL